MKITGSGLLAIACAVVLLWSCLIGERVMMQRAQAQRALVMRGIDAQQSWRKPRPAAAPAHAPSQAPVFAVG